MKNKRLIDLETVTEEELLEALGLRLERRGGLQYVRRASKDDKDETQSERN